MGATFQLLAGNDYCKGDMQSYNRWEIQIGKKVELKKRKNYFISYEVP